MLGHHQVPAWRDGLAGGEIVLDCAVQPPAGQIDRIAAAVIEFNPLFSRLLNATDRLRGIMVIHDLVDHDFGMKSEAVGCSGCGLIGMMPGAGSIRRAATELALNQHRIQQPVLGGRIEEQPVASLPPKTQRGLVQAQETTSGNGLAIWECISGVCAATNGQNVIRKREIIRSIVHQFQPEKLIGRSSHFIQNQIRRCGRTRKIPGSWSAADLFAHGPVFCRRAGRIRVQLGQRHARTIRPHRPIPINSIID